MTLRHLSVLAEDDDDPIGPTTQTISQTAAATPQLSTLVSALNAAELTATLNGTGPFTVFAPVNSAFSALPADVLQRLQTGAAYTSTEYILARRTQTLMRRQFERLTEIPIIFYYGDNIPTEPTDIAGRDNWRVRLAMARLFVEAM